MGRNILARRATVALASLIPIFMEPVLAQVQPAPIKIDAPKAQTLDLFRPGRVVSTVRRFIDEGRWDEAEPILLGTYAKMGGFPVGYPDRQEVVDGLGLIYWHSKRMIELELLHEGERRDKGNAEYALMHIPDLPRLDDFAQSFELAQARSSEAAFALARMAVRQVAKLPSDQSLVRERQELFDEWKSAATASSVLVPPARRLEISSRVAEIDARLATLLPDRAKRAANHRVSIGEELVEDRPLTLAGVQKNLESDEALLLFANFKRNEGELREFLFLWVVTKTEYTLQRIELGPISLRSRVAALRCGLDAAAWNGEGELDCQNLLGTTFARADIEGGKQLPFDHGRAFALYKLMFSGVSHLISGRHLLIVPSGPLTQLPFHVLLTASPSSSDHKKVAWLARDQAITVLPAVSSLEALRRISKPSVATKPFVGFGNPLLDGNQSHPLYGMYYKNQAELARGRNGCAETVAQGTAAIRALSRSPTNMPQHSGLVDLAHLRRQAPLPETADELCAVARDFKADLTEIRLGARATEGEVKALSASGELAQFRILHFATHGALAGQLSGTTEPGLILTPPAQASELDDGYLSASEIAGLKLDADWVILSACNTAGAGKSGNDDGSEALSGLASAFFYAQARALLVSHWGVSSNATVKLITATVGAITSNKSIGRSEALRRAMTRLIDEGLPHEAHPAYWAPFVVVGEGAPMR